MSPAAGALGGAAVAAGAARRGWWMLLLLLAAAGVLALRMALSAFSGASLHVDEAQYWDWSRQFAWGYYSKPPLIAALMAASTALFGHHEVGLRALAQLCWVLTGLVLALLARAVARQAGRDDADAVGAWAAAALWTGPLAGLVGLVATTDAPLMLLWSLALAALWQALHGATRAARTVAWLGFGLALGLGLLDKYTMAALLPGALWWVWRHRRAAAPACAAALFLALLLLAPNLLWNAEAGWPTWRHTAEITVQAQRPAAGGLGGLLGYAAMQLVVAGPVLMAAWAVTAWRRRSAAGQADAVPPMPPAWRALLLAAALPLLAVGLVQSARSHAEANWIAPAHLSLVLALAWLAPRWWRRRRLAWMLLGAQLALVTLMAGGASLWLALQPGARVATGLDPWMRMRGWDTALAALEPQLPAPAAASAPELLLIGSTRTVLVQAAYHWRHRPMLRAAVAGGPRPANHYELVCPWQPARAVGRPVVMLTEDAEPPALGVGPAAPQATLLASASRQPGRPEAADGPRLFLWRVSLPATLPAPAGAAAAGRSDAGLCR